VVKTRIYVVSLLDFILAPEGGGSSDRSITPLTTGLTLLSCKFNFCRTLASNCDVLGQCAVIPIGALLKHVVDVILKTQSQKCSHTQQSSPLTHRAKLWFAHLFGSVIWVFLAQCGPKFNSLIPEPLHIYFESLMTTATTISVIANKHCSMVVYLG